MKYLPGWGVPPMATRATGRRGHNEGSISSRDSRSAVMPAADAVAARSAGRSRPGHRECALAGSGRGTAWPCLTVFIAIWLTARTIPGSAASFVV